MAHKQCLQIDTKLKDDVMTSRIELRRWIAWTLVRKGQDGRKIEQNDGKRNSGTAIGSKAPVRGNSCEPTREYETLMRKGLDERPKKQNVHHFHHVQSEKEKKEGHERDSKARLSHANPCATLLCYFNVDMRWNVFKLRASIEKSISSLQIGLNVQLKDSTKKQSRAFKMSPFFGYWLRNSHALISWVIKDREFTSEWWIEGVKLPSIPITRSLRFAYSRVTKGIMILDM